MKPLTDKQARIAFLVDQGYPASEVAQFIERRPAVVADQCRLIRQKRPIHLSGATESRVPLRKLPVGRVR